MAEEPRTIEQEHINSGALKAEVVQALQGTSAFGSALIRDLIQQSESRLISLEQKLAAIQEDLHQRKPQRARFSQLHRNSYPPM